MGGTTIVIYAFKFNTTKTLAALDKQPFISLILLKTPPPNPFSLPGKKFEWLMRTTIAWQKFVISIVRWEQLWGMGGVNVMVWVIVRVCSVVLIRTVVGVDWGFDNRSGSHHQRGGVYLNRLLEQTRGWGNFIRLWKQPCIRGMVEFVLYTGKNHREWEEFESFIRTDTGLRKFESFMRTSMDQNLSR